MSTRQLHAKKLVMSTVNNKSRSSPDKYTNKRNQGKMNLIVKIQKHKRTLFLLYWVKWLRMQGHCLPATLEVTGSNPGPGKINVIKLKKKHQRNSRLLKVHLSMRKKGHLS